ncbi:MAG: hypothetical protein JWO84_95 [Parcubacteria group bacterium]|nr:hypothetical protein [Parcubacteria group bacterium]
MDAFLKMDIFFVVTTVSVALTTILLAVVLIRVLRILKNIEDISLMVEEEGERLKEDIAQVRAKVKEEGLRVTHMFDFLKLAKPRKRSKKS